MWLYLTYSNGNCSQCLLAAIEHDLRQTLRVVTYLFTVVQQISTHDLRGLIECFVNRIVDANLISTLRCIALRLFAADAAIVDDDKIEVNLRRVLLDRFDVLAGTVAVCFPRLSHQVVHEDLSSARLTDHWGHLSH